MRIFLDSSVLLAASGSLQGTSYAILQKSKRRKWEIVTSFYCIAEVEKNLSKIRGAKQRWKKAVFPKLAFVEDIFSSRYPLLLTAGKDKPVLISACACKANYLLTLDTADFELLLGTKVYGVYVTTPWDFLERHW